VSSDSVLALEQLIHARASVRSFRPDDIDMAMVERAVAAAGWAPSPHGTQPWRFVVVDQPDTRRRLASAMAETWREQLRADTMEAEEIERRVRNSLDRIETPPVVVIACLFLGEAHHYPDPRRQEAERIMAIQSLGAAAQNFLLMIHAQGLAAGWMCAPLFCPDVISATLQLDSSLVPHAMFPVGFEDVPPRRRERRALETLMVQVSDLDQH
jgi:coenzyme F420-0:L-glutamate ligase/coenzyme F420-1:gamma-L-glutamate ligase